jgi:hypothetical protein
VTGFVTGFVTDFDTDLEAGFAAAFAGALPALLTVLFTETTVLFLADDLMAGFDLLTVATALAAGRDGFDLAGGVDLRRCFAMTTPEATAPEYGTSRMLGPQVPDARH